MESTQTGIVLTRLIQLVTEQKVVTQSRRVSRLMLCFYLILRKLEDVTVRCYYKLILEV